MQSNSREPLIVAHLESRLGRIVGGWRGQASKTPVNVDVVEFSRPPFPEVRAFATIGLSRMPLRSRQSKKMIRQELLWMHRSGTDAPDVFGLLCGVVSLCAKGHALLRGDVVELGRPFGAESRLSALYATQPAYFPDDFAVCKLESGEPCVVVWLFGVTSREAEFARKEGWDRFEQLLLEQDPDLLDLRRSELTGLP